MNYDRPYGTWHDRVGPHRAPPGGAPPPPPPPANAMRFQPNPHYAPTHAHAYLPEPVRPPPSRPDYWDWQREQERARLAFPAATDRARSDNAAHRIQPARAAYSREREPERAAWPRPRSRSPPPIASSSRTPYPPPFRASYPPPPIRQVSPPPPPPSQPLSYNRRQFPPPIEEGRIPLQGGSQDRRLTSASPPRSYAGQSFEPGRSSEYATDGDRRAALAYPPPPPLSPLSQTYYAPTNAPSLPGDQTWMMSQQFGFPPHARASYPSTPAPAASSISGPVLAQSRPPLPPASSVLPLSAPDPASGHFAALQNPDAVSQVNVSSQFSPKSTTSSPRSRPALATSTHITWPRSPSPPRRPSSLLDTQAATLSPKQTRSNSPPVALTAVRESGAAEIVSANGVARIKAVDESGSSRAEPPIVALGTDDDDPEASPLLYPPSPAASPPSPRSNPNPVPLFRPVSPGAGVMDAEPSLENPEEDRREEARYDERGDGRLREVDTEEGTVDEVDAQSLMAELEREIEREAIERLRTGGEHDNDYDDGDEVGFGIEGLEEIMGWTESTGNGIAVDVVAGGAKRETNQSPEWSAPAGVKPGDKSLERLERERQGSPQEEQTRLASTREDPQPMSATTDVSDGSSAVIPEVTRFLTTNIHGRGEQRTASHAAEEEEEENSGDDEAFVASTLVSQRPTHPTIPVMSATPQPAGEAQGFPVVVDDSNGYEDEGEEVELDMTADDTQTFEDAIQPFSIHDDDDEAGNESGIEGRGPNALVHQGSEFDFEMGSGDEVLHEQDDSTMEDGESSGEEEGRGGHGHQGPRKKRRLRPVSRAQSFEPSDMDVERPSAPKAGPTEDRTAQLDSSTFLVDAANGADPASRVARGRDLERVSRASSFVPEVGQAGEAAIPDNNAQTLPLASESSELQVGDDLEEGELPAEAVDTSETQRGTTKEATQPQAALFARTATSLLPNGKAVYRRRIPLTAPIVSPVVAPVIDSTKSSTTPNGTPPHVASKGVYTRRALLAGTDPLTISSLSTLNAANAAATTPPTSATKAFYERPPGLVAAPALSKAKGALPLSREEKLARVPSKLSASFPTEFPTPSSVEWSRVFGPPAYSANPSKALAHQPDEKAQWGFWPCPPPLKAGKAVFPAPPPPPQVVADLSKNASTTTTPLDAAARRSPRIEVFIDHSNVFYSFLNWVRARKDAKVIQKLYKTASDQAGVGGKPRSVKILTLAKGRKVKLDYDVLFGLLERGRKVERRVLVGSSPMWQSLEPAVNWGYEVSLLQRVPRMLPVESAAHNQASSTPATSGANPTTSKKRDQKGNFITKEIKHYKEQAVDELVHLKILESILDYDPPPLSLPGVECPPPASESVPIDSREADVAEIPESNPRSQGDATREGGAEMEVPSDEDQITGTGTCGGDDEAIPGQDGSARARTEGASSSREESESADQDDTRDATTTTPCTRRSRPTLVIATGDANSSEYNPGGFLGCVRRALDRGWDVEIASFSTHGLSSLWSGERAKRVTDDGRARGELRIVNLETFAEELVN